MKFKISWIQTLTISKFSNQNAKGKEISLQIGSWSLIGVEAFILEITPLITRKTSI
jgi:hypothetical protein